MADDGFTVDKAVTGRRNHADSPQALQPVAPWNGPAPEPIGPVLLSSRVHGRQPMARHVPLLLIMKWTIPPTRR